MKFDTIQILSDYRNSIADSKEGLLDIRVCAGPGCLARGSAKIARELEAEIKRQGVEAKVALQVKRTGCHGLCECGPMITFERPLQSNGSQHPLEGTMYAHVKVKDIPKIVEETILKGELIPDLFYSCADPSFNPQKYIDIPFYSRQTRIALEKVGVVDPESLDSYLAAGGFTALEKVLSGMKPNEIVDEIDKSALRGRGGGGFKTGRKWKSCKKAKAEIEGSKCYVLCNGDEGDPGAFMDRAIMEGDPYSVLEGMIIAAYALESDTGYIYVRNEYPLAVEHLQQALNELNRAGLLGENILGSGFSFNIRINRGGGAFVCGESSALMRSMEGKVGEPRAKYIHSTERGLYDQPTVLNNVETYVNLTWIINHGADEFLKIGNVGNSGTKAFSLVGTVNNTGLIEVPMGTSLREIIFDIGGGIRGGRKFKAVQTGGPSGGCLPEEKLDLPVDFDTLTKAGSMMGSGGMIVMDDRTCMVDVAKYFIHFLMEESCGKCHPCREGLIQMNYLLEKVTKGEGGIEVLDQIERLAEAMELGSLCGLGQSAPNPVLSTLMYFRDEYKAHLVDKKCPAGVCKPLITYSVIEENCNGCYICFRQCPEEAITGAKKEVHHIDTEKCTRCGICFAVCKFDAIRVE